MLLRINDRKDSKLVMPINNKLLINQPKTRVFIKAPLINKSQHSINNDHKEETTETSGLVQGSNNRLMAQHYKDQSHLFSTIPKQLNPLSNITHTMDPSITASIPSLYFQQYQKFTSSSSYINEGITIHQNTVSTTTVISPSNNSATSMQQLSNSNTLHLHSSYSSDVSQNTDLPQLYQSQSHNDIAPSLSTAVIPPGNQLSNSFKNLTCNSSNMINKDEAHNSSGRSSNNSCNLPISGHPNNYFPRLNQSLNCPENYLNQNTVNLPPPNFIPKASLIKSTISKHSTESLPMSKSYQPLRNQLSTQSSPGIYSTEVKPNLPSINTNQLTPSRRMINVMEERTLIPYSGISNPVPNILHITKKANCNPNIMRCTLNAMPCSDDLLSKTHLPLALMLHPFRDLPSLQVIRSKKIIRCRTLTCRAYINPFVYFIDQKRWKCNMCLRMNELSDDSLYNNTGDYFDIPKKFEFRLPTIEYIAPKEYSLKNSHVPLYVFLIDVSCNATHLLYHNTIGKILNTIEQLLERFPGYQNIKISIIAYDSGIHFYTINQKGFQEIFVSDITSPIEIPVTIDITVDLHHHLDHIQRLLSCLLENVENCPYQERNYNSCLGSALVVAKKLFNNSGGRITIFNASCPSIGEGILIPRECEKSANVLPLNPTKEFYKSLSLEFAQSQIAVDLFQLGAVSCDLPSLSIISQYCSGSLFSYPNLSFRVLSDVDPSLDTVQTVTNETQRLISDLTRYLTRKIGFDAVLRVRFSGGFNILSSHGNFFARAPDLFSMANVNPDSGVSLRLGIEDNFIDSNAVFFQAALLYTSSVGERRIRVHTLCIPVSLQIDDVFRMADHQAVAVFLAKSVADRLQMNGNVSEAREALINAVIDPSVAFGKFCLSISQRLISLPFPYHLRMLPLFVWGILQSKCLRVRKNDVHLSVSILNSWRNMPLSYLLIDIYPNLYNLINVIDLTSRQKQMFQYSTEEINNDHNPSEHSESVKANVEEETYSSESDDEESSSCDSEACSEISCYKSKLLEDSIDTIKSMVESDNEEEFWYPDQLHLSKESLSRSGVYLLDTINGIYIFIGVDTPKAFLKLIFGAESRSEINCDGPFQLPDLNNACSAHLRVFIREIQVERPLGSSMFIVNNDKSIINSMFTSQLLEDDQLDSSYHRFLQHVQKKVNHSN